MRISNSMNGSISMSCLPRCLLLMLMSLLSLSIPAEPEDDRDAPSIELLEFIAEWETSEGDWAGPEQFEDDAFDQLYDDEEDDEL